MKTVSRIVQALLPIVLAIIVWYGVALTVERVRGVNFPTPIETAIRLGEMHGGREIATFGGLGNNYPIMLLANELFITERQDDMKRFLTALKRAQNMIENRVSSRRSPNSRCCHFEFKKWMLRDFTCSTVSFDYLTEPASLLRNSA